MRWVEGETSDGNEGRSWGAGDGAIAMAALMVKRVMPVQMLDRSWGGACRAAVGDGRTGRWVSMEAISGCFRCVGLFCSVVFCFLLDSSPLFCFCLLQRALGVLRAHGQMDRTAASEVVGPGFFFY